MPKPDSLQGSVALLVLKILSRRPRLHGCAIMTVIEEMSRVVLRLEEALSTPHCIAWRKRVWIRAEWIFKETGRRPRVYELTVAGRNRLTQEESRWQAVTFALNRVFRMA